MALLLLGAAIVAGIGLREQVDAAAILAIVVLNAAIGVVEEGRAASALEALRTIQTPTAKVIRDSSIRTVATRELVPGDVAVLSSGDRVPGDLRLAESSSLEIDESVLTGESLPAEKDATAAPLADASLGDRRWMAFAGTHVTRGSGRGIVVATGGTTAVGRIAGDLAAPEPTTPLQRELRDLTSRLGLVAVAVAAGVFGLTFLRTGLTSESAERSFLAAVALAVAAVPEGLATVVTVALALGVRRMAQRGAIVRRLPAVETLGATTVILTDKTGTLTENRMLVTAVAAAGGTAVEPGKVPAGLAEKVAEVALLCNDATLDPPVGDPVDVALLEAFSGFDVDDVRSRMPRLSAIPFDASRRRMTTIHGSGSRIMLATKGAPESVLARCSHMLTSEGSTEALGDARRAQLGSLADHLAESGMRMLGFARRDLVGPSDDVEEAERDLVFVALVGLRDPVRNAASTAIAETRSAGIRLVMVTGDHPGTAAAVAHEVGLPEGPLQVLTGSELRRSGIPEEPLSATVYARVDPDQKLSLVEAFQRNGHVVAVTGDGVNDAPALRRADIGVAMGRAGSDVAREAADMVVTDDDLATIVTAVREGRGIYDNIRKVIEYLVAGNLSEIAVVVVAILLFPGIGVPLLPLQLLWVNLLTDGLPALALGLDPPDRSLMRRLPRPSAERILSARRIGRLSARGAAIAAAALGSLAISRFVWNESWTHARATMFTVLVVAHLLYAFAVRSPEPMLDRLATNRALFLAVGLGIGLQVAIIAWPAAHGLFGTASLTVRGWLLVAAAGIAPAAGMVAVQASHTGQREAD
jgi:Ca2+-transporting ATPase